MSGINSILESKFQIGRSLPFAFIDSWAKHPLNIDDPFQQEAFNRETEILWEEATASEEFLFKSVQDILVIKLDIFFLNSCEQLLSYWITYEWCIFFATTFCSCMELNFKKFGEVWALSGIAFIIGILPQKSPHECWDTLERGMLNTNEFQWLEHKISLVSTIV